MYTLYVCVCVRWFLCTMYIHTCPYKLTAINRVSIYISGRARFIIIVIITAIIIIIFPIGNVQDRIIRCSFIYCIIFHRKAIVHVTR